MTSQPPPGRIISYILAYSAFLLTLCVVGGRALSTFH
jgi:hypothetical protein